MKEHAGKYRFSEGEQQKTEIFFRGRRIPAILESAIEDYIRKKTGKPYQDPVILERLGRAVVAQKADYWKYPAKRRLSYAKGYAVLGYLAYHFPVYFMQTEYLLRELGTAGLLKPAMAVLDVGTGPGVVPLAVADFFSRLDNTKVTVFSIEKAEEHIEAFRFLRGTASTLSEHARLPDPVAQDIRSIDEQKIPAMVDLIVFSNVLNELESIPVESQVEIVLRFSHHLAPDGTILIAEPAEEMTATHLRILSRTLRDRGLTVHSPCSFLWGTRCDPSRCWSFATQPDILPTTLMRALAARGEPFRYLNTDIKYAYAIFRRDETVGISYRIPPHANVARLSKLHMHVNRRIDVIAAKMSHDLGDKKTHVYKICDGTAAKPVYAVLPEYHRISGNDLLTKEPYGGVLELRQVLVRYNKRYDAYNLLVSKKTGILPVVT